MHASLPTEAWAELYEATCCLENCLPTSANPQKKSAKEMRHGRPTDVSSLRTIGSPCVVYTLPKHRRAQEDRGMKGKIVGCSKQSHCYRVKPNGSTRIMESAHITVFEKIPLVGETLVTGTEDENIDELEETVEVTQESQPQAPVPNVPVVHVPAPQAPAPQAVVQAPAPQALDKTEGKTPQGSHQSEHIRILAEFAAFIDPELLVEGEIVSKCSFIH